MRKGIKFHSGNPVTAQDAAYSLQRAVIMNKTPGFILTQFGFTKENVEGEDQGDRRPDAGHRDRRAVGADLLLLLPDRRRRRRRRHEDASRRTRRTATSGNEWLKTNSAGSGPFKLVSWKANEPYTLERWDGYWGTKALPRRVIVRHVPEAADPAPAAREGRHRHRAQPQPRTSSTPSAATRTSRSSRRPRARSSISA